MNGLALFAGVAGLDLGINLALPESRAVCYVEGEAYAAAVLAKQMGEGRLHPAPIWSNVVTFDGKPWRGKVDFISGGFPCQPWSVAGKQKGIEDERWLWDDIERIIREVQPRFVFLENVPGLINGGLSPVLKSLAQIGFNAEWGTLRASDVGANHHRNRVFIFAYRPDSYIGRVEKLALSDSEWQKIPHDSRICSDVSDSNHGRGTESFKQIQAGRDIFSLHVQMFPTPTAQEAQKAGKYAKGQMGQSLSAMAKRGQLFNTPTTRDGANATLPPSHANWDSLTGDMIRLGEARPGGVLNPEWVEWLMGWPIGWTDLEHVETESSHFKPGSHIQSSSIELSKGGA